MAQRVRTDADTRDTGSNACGSHQLAEVVRSERLSGAQQKKALTWLAQGRPRPLDITSHLSNGSVAIRHKALAITLSGDEQEALAHIRNE